MGAGEMIRVARDGMAACNQIQTFASLHLLQCVYYIHLCANQPTRQNLYLPSTFQLSTLLHLETNAI